MNSRHEHGAISTCWEVGWAWLGGTARWSLLCRTGHTTQNIGNACTQLASPPHGAIQRVTPQNEIEGFYFILFRIRDVFCTQHLSCWGAKHNQITIFGAILKKRAAAACQQIATSITQSRAAKQYNLTPNQGQVIQLARRETDTEVARDAGDRDLFFVGQTSARLRARTHTDSTHAGRKNSRALSQRLSGPFAWLKEKKTGLLCYVHFCWQRGGTGQ